MLKKDLIKEVAAESGRNQETVRAVLEATDVIVRRALAQGREVMLFGLGKLITRVRGEKKARDMATGLACIVPTRRVALFKPSDAVVAAANSPAPEAA